jgi:hypothetical protein
MTQDVLASRFDSRASYSMSRSLRTHLCVVSLLGQEGEERVRIEEAFVLAFWSDLPLLWPYRSYLLVQIALGID